MKKFFGGIFIEREKLLSAGIKYPIKLEYYKTINKENTINKEIYGIQIVKTEYKEEIEVEEQKIEYITENEKQAEKILTIFKENEVTPVSAQYVIDDMLKQNI